MKNWKTTLAGFASIIVGISTIINRPEQLETGITSITLGFGLIFAKDNNVSGK